eukprot:s6045_g4.t1
MQGVEKRRVLTADVSTASAAVSKRKEALMMIGHILILFASCRASGHMIGEEDYDHLYKLVLVGDATVGKTHILSRYIKGTLPKAPTATIGVEFATRTVSLDAGCAVKAQIWDTAGQERYRAITSAHYRRAVGALLVYDVTKPATFKSCERWMEELRSNAEPDIVIMLVGNKADLAEKNPGDRQVDFDAAADFAAQQGLLFEEASAVTGANIKLCFEKLLKEIYSTTQHRRDREDDPTNNFQLQGLQGRSSQTECAC